MESAGTPPAPPSPANGLPVSAPPACIATTPNRQKPIKKAPAFQELSELGASTSARKRLVQRPARQPPRRLRGKLLFQQAPPKHVSPLPACAKGAVGFDAILGGFIFYFVKLFGSRKIFGWHTSNFYLPAVWANPQTAFSIFCLSSNIT